MKEYWYKTVFSIKYPHRPPPTGEVVDMTVGVCMQRRIKSRRWRNSWPLRSSKHSFLLLLSLHKWSKPPPPPPTPHPISGHFRAFNPTYNHVVADVAERGLLEDVLHETVPRRVYLQRVARLQARRGRGSAGDGRGDGGYGEAGGVRRSHPDAAEVAGAAAHICQQLCLVVVAASEKVVGTLAADALGLEGQGALEPLQLKPDRKSWTTMEQERIRRGRRRSKEVK